MNTCKLLPKLPLKTFACDGGGYLRDTNRLMTMCTPPPEIPLTKALTEECYRKPPKLPSHQQAIRPKTTCANDAQIKKSALSGLSNWYNNHLNAMNAIQKFKEFHEEDDLESQNYYDQLANFNYSKSLKYKRQAAGPHIDLENYLMSLKSRQKELSSFTKQSRAWERYFEAAIPGWTEITQRKHINAELMDKIVDGLHKLNVASSSKQTVTEQQQPKKLSSEAILDDQLDTELVYQRTPPTNPQQVKQNKLSVRFSDDLRTNQINAAYYADMEDRARTIFQQIPEVKSEGKGHINNETIFEDVYGKYFAGGRRENSGADQGKGNSKSQHAKHSKQSKRSKGKRNKKKLGKAHVSKPKEKSSAQAKQQRCCASPTATTFFEVTDDPKVFARKAASTPESPTRVLLVGNKKALPTKKTKALLTRKDINSQQMLVVDSNKKNSAKTPRARSELGTAKPKQSRPPSNSSFLSFTKPNWSLNR